MELKIEVQQRKLAETSLFFKNFNQVDRLLVISTEQKDTNFQYSN